MGGAWNCDWEFDRDVTEDRSDSALSSKSLMLAGRLTAPPLRAGEEAELGSTWDRGSADTSLASGTVGSDERLEGTRSGKVGARGGSAMGDTPGVLGADKLGLLAVLVVDTPSPVAVTCSPRDFTLVTDDAVLTAPVAEAAVMTIAPAVPEASGAVNTTGRASTGSAGRGGACSIKRTAASLISANSEEASDAPIGSLMS